MGVGVPVARARWVFLFAGLLDLLLLVGDKRSPEDFECEWLAPARSGWLEQLERDGHLDAPVAEEQRHASVGLVLEDGTVASGQVGVFGSTCSAACTFGHVKRLGRPPRASLRR